MKVKEVSKRFELELQESCISLETARQHGVYTSSDPHELVELVALTQEVAGKKFVAPHRIKRGGFDPSVDYEYLWAKGWGECAVFPVFDSSGKLIYHRIKPEVPEQWEKDGKKQVMKYVNPYGLSGANLSANFGPTFLEEFRRAKIVYFVEGEKKAMLMRQLGFCTVCLSGVWMFRPKGGCKLYKELLGLDFNDKECRVLFDTDVPVNQQVHQAAAELALQLKRQTKCKTAREIWLPMMTDEAGRPVKSSPDDYAYKVGTQALIDFLKSQEQLSTKRMSLTDFRKEYL